jgi:DNA mismatch repair protein MSH6
MDKNKVKKGEPNYDPTTLYIPPNEWKEFTPGMY